MKRVCSKTHRVVPPNTLPRFPTVPQDNRPFPLCLETERVTWKVFFCFFLEIDYERGLRSEEALAGTLAEIVGRAVVVPATRRGAGPAAFFC